MSYGDGLWILAQEAASAVQVETSAADVDEWLMPADYTVLAFGVYVAEDFVAHATDFTIKLQQRPTVGGTSTTLATLVLQDDQNLKAGDGTKPGQTAMAALTDLDTGDVVLANGLPKSGRSGEFLAIEVTTATGTAGGAVIPFAIVRMDGGPDTRQTNVWIVNDSSTNP